SEETVLAALADRSPVVRRHAVRWAEPFLKSRKVAEALLPLAADSDTRVRLQAAALLGGWAEPRGLGTLAKLVAAEKDSHVLSAAVSGLTAETALAVYELADRFRNGPLPHPFVRDAAATLVAVEPRSELGLVAAQFAGRDERRGVEEWLAGAVAVTD